MSFLTQSHQVFFRHRLCLIPSTSHVIQRLTQSLSSFRWTVPNHLNLLLLIIKLTGSNPKSSLEFFTFLPLIQLNPTHPSDHTHFSAVHLQFMLNFQFLFFQRSTSTTIIYHLLLFEMGNNPKFWVWVCFGFFDNEGSVLFQFSVPSCVPVRFKFCKRRVRVLHRWHGKMFPRSSVTD